MKSRRVIVKQDPDKPVEVEVLAEAIVEISKSAKRLASSRLNQKAIVILIAHSTGLGQGTVKAVLEGISDLEQTYLRR